MLLEYQTSWSENGFDHDFVYLDEGSPDDSAEDLGTDVHDGEHGVDAAGERHGEGQRRVEMAAAGGRQQEKSNALSVTDWLINGSHVASTKFDTWL